MRNLLAFFAALLLTFAVVGWWLDWYRLRTTTTDGKTSVTVDFNPDKIGADLRKGQEAIQKSLAERAARMEAERKAEEQKKAVEEKKGEDSFSFE